MTHDDSLRLLVAGAALDDLEPDERVAFEAHAETCGECRVLESELAMVLADLSLAVPERLPPPDLLVGIRRAIGAEDARAGGVDETVDNRRVAGRSSADAAPAPIASVSSISAARSARRPQRMLVAAVGIAAGLALVAVGLGGRTLGLQEQLDRSTAQVAALRAQVTNQGGVVAAAMQPGHVSVALHAEPLAPRATATLVFVPGSTSAWLVAEDLPATPAGQGYQLWYADDAGVHPLQTVSYDGSGPFVAPLGVDLAESAAVMITLEDAGGARGEPGPQVVFGEI